MTEKKSSRYANIACALFVLLAVFTIVPIAFSCIDIKTKYLDFGASYLIYWVVNTLGTLLPAVIYLMIAYMFKKQNESSLILLLTIFLTQYLFFSVIECYNMGEFATYEVSQLFRFIAFVFFTAMLFAFVKGKRQFVNQFHVFSVIFYMLFLVIYGIYIGMYMGIADLIQKGGFDSLLEEGLSGVVEVFCLVLPIIIHIAIFFIVGAYLKNRESVNNVFYDIEEEKQNSINPIEIIGSAEKIKEYKDMLDSGIITQNEFDKIKLQLLNTANRGVK